MANIEECTKSRPVLKVLGPIATQVVELRGRQGVECDAQTILRLIKLCHALKESCALLPARLTQHARSLRDTELDRAAGQAGRRLERVVDALTDATRDLYQGGEVDVCDYTEVWSSILDTTEQLLSALTDALLAWDRSQLRRLTTAANQMHSCLSRLLQVYSLQHLPQEFQVMVSSGAVLARLVEWRCQELCQRGQKEGVMVASLQLRWAMTLLAKVCVASSTTDTTGGLPMDSCHAKVSRALVVNRVKQLVDEVVTQAGPGPPHTPKHDPAAFTTCIDNILDVLLGQEKLKRTETEEQEKEDSAPRDEEKSQDENREDVVKDENQMKMSRIEEDRNIEKERIIKKKEDEAEEVKRNRTDETEEGEEVIKKGEKKEGVSVRVRPLLEVALQHSLAVACCAIKQDHTAIMTAAENVLRQVKVLVNQERQQVPDKVDFQMACDTLADATEVLEQHVNTALIRLIVQVFSLPEAPLDALVEALGLETNTTGRSGANCNCKEEGSETGNKEESSASSSKEASGTDCMEENRGTKRERKQSEESRVENLVADFDLHVDRVFQAGGLAVACTTDPPKVQLIEGSLSTLEWLEGCLVPALLTAAHAHSTSATTHAFLLLEHWKNVVATLTSCLHNIMDPAAFVMVSQNEVQRVWADLRAGLYSQDTEWVKRQADQVVALTSRVLHLHQTQCSGDSGGNGFLTDTQTQDLITAMNEVKGKVRALAAAPSDLARHRSLLKRVQLCLTQLSRLMTSLNHDYEEHLDQTYQTHADVTRSSAHPPKLTKTERYQLVTSDINDIPLDLATPVPTPAAPPLHHRQLRRSLRSSSKLSEWRPLTSGEHSVVASGNGRGESVAMCDTSIDISRFLSRSTNLLSSTRGSRRNITLKVKEINLDLAGDLVVRPHQPPKQDEDYSMGEVKQNPSLVEVSELIAEHGSLAPPSHQTLSHHLSGILETVTSMVGDLASPPHLPSPGQKRKCPWESFSDKNKENDSTSPNTVLHGIKLQHASFNPHFPDITPEQDSGLFKGDEEEEMVKVESSDNDIVGDSCQTLGEAQDYQEVWKDFTAIIENHTPVRTDGLNFSNNFVIQDPLTPLLPPKPPVPNKSCEMKSTAADLSDTPFLKVSGPGSTQYIAASSSSLFRHASNSSLGSSTSVSSSSASITTPQRLLDLQVVQQRLHRLRRSLRC
ncbi:hypothetical protein Pmani_017966 [Petrolisthes manimaculis]|uniref:Uncharacterized protein n=1 Tax=Petrolisthes manimaculis TaxID=1843537 RepID=A0AAE1PNG0_9EUCA|nr:hypothetical protein Pmani_017966 [Petrolisthes manimaculis]